MSSKTRCFWKEIEGTIKVKGRRRRRRKQLKEKRSYCELKEEALNRSVWKLAVEEKMDFWERLCDDYYYYYYYYYYCGGDDDDDDDDYVVVVVVIVVVDDENDDDDDDNDDDDYDYDDDDDDIATAVCLVSFPTLIKCFFAYEQFQNHQFFHCHMS